MADIPTVDSTPEELAVFIAGEWAASNRALIEASAYTDARVITAGLALADAHMHRAGLALALFRKLHPEIAAEFETELKEQLANGEFATELTLAWLRGPTGG